MPKNSYLTVTDQFCGAGGSSIGAVAAGVELKLAMNHWQRAIETHNSNFPNALHDCADMSATNPRRYPATDILITSPECTNHSLAKGKKRKSSPQLDMFGKPTVDPSEERSRATMWDVPRFAEIHRYNIIIVENVVDARYWELWEAWLHAMDLLGYNHQIVYFNSMHAHPTPQSRDRMYVVFWRKGNRAPKLDFHPKAHCSRCQLDVDAVQAWKKPNNRWGRYRKQYVYVCPACASTVEPYYYCAANAIDWAIPAPRIGDRDKPLKEKTLARIQAGLERYARPYLFDTVHTARGDRHQDMVWPVDRPGRTQIGTATHGMVVPPFAVETAFSHAGDDRSQALDASLGTQTTRQTVGLVVPPLIINMQGESRATLLDEPLPTQLGTNHRWLMLPFLSSYYGTNEGSPLDAAVPTVTTLDKHALVVPPFILNMQADNAPTEMCEPLPTQLTGDHRYLVAPPFIASLNRSDVRNRPVDAALNTVMPQETPTLVVPPFIVSYYTRTYGDGAALARVDESLPTQPTWPVHYLASPGAKPTVEDCGFRMLQPHEIQKAMAFPAHYRVLGTQREKVKQLGNAVTPPVMAMLINRCVESLS